MGDKLKSAYELAMERLAKKDATSGQAPPAPLSLAQKRKIEAVRQEYVAKLAEQEILHRARCRDAAGDPEALARLEDDNRRDREHLESRREGRIAALREEAKS